MNTSNIITKLRDSHHLAADAAVMVKHVPAEIKAEDPLRFSATISTDTLDRDDEVLLPTGMMPDEFNESGMVFWNHNYDKPVAFPDRPKVAGSSVLCGAKWMERPENYVGEWFPDFAKALCQQASSLGRAIGVSVGFIAMDYRVPSKKDIETWGDRIRRVITRWKLLEWSIAPVQSNPSAIVTAVGKGLVSREAAKACFPDMEIPDTKPRKTYVIPVDVTPRRNTAKLRDAITKSVTVAVAKRLGKLYV